MSAGAPGSPARTALVVDDSQDQADLLRLHLERLGYEVELVATAEAAIRSYRVLQPRVAIIDLRLPGIDGWQLVRTMKDEVPDCVLVARVLGTLFPDDVVSAAHRGMGIHDMKVLIADDDEDLRDLVTIAEVGAVLRSAAESARPTADAAGVALHTVVDAGEVVVLADATRLGQAVDNILSNAVKFTPRGGSVTLELAVEGDDVRISVADTGYGIASSELHRLSERFFRASTATKNAVQGVGLGLTITKAIVTAHGGRIDIASELGEGTTMIIVLPRPH